MNHPRIKRDPKVMEGKPVIVGHTHHSRTHLCAALRAGETEAEIVADYPPLTLEDIRAPRLSGF